MLTNWMLPLGSLIGRSPKRAFANFGPQETLGLQLIIGTSNVSVCQFRVSGDIEVPAKLSDMSVFSLSANFAPQGTLGLQLLGDICSLFVFVNFGP